MAMIIKSHFKIAVPRDDAFRVLTDIERSAPCFPGSELGEKQADGSYKGAFTVKLGPLAFRFSGKFGIVETHPETGAVKITASGNDTKGRGGAQALVDVSMNEVNGSTEVQIVSDVTLSGSVAQYGRGTGMIQALSQQLINDFAANLSALMAQDRAAAAPSNANMNTTAAAAAGTQAAAAAPAGPSAPPAPSHKPAASLSATSLVWRAFLSWLRAKFSSDSSRS